MCKCNIIYVYIYIYIYIHIYYFLFPFFSPAAGTHRGPNAARKSKGQGPRSRAAADDTSGRAAEKARSPIALSGGAKARRGKECGAEARD